MADGSWLMSTSDVQVSGLYTPAGAIRGKTGPGVGIYHPSGALRIQLNGPGQGVYDNTGALRVAEFVGPGVYSNTGAIRVTVV